MTTGDSIEKRGRTLEEEFFHRVDRKLLEEMQSRLRAEAGQRALAAACPWANESMLRSLVSAKITAESLVSLTLVPLVRVAWADGRIEHNERDALLKAADENHCPEGSIGHQLLEAWLDEPPNDTLFEAWKQYTNALATQLSDDDRQNLRDEVTGKARAIAKSAGGILGIHAISKEEEAVLAEIDSAFA